MQVPEVWQATAASEKCPGRWWEAVDTVALDVSCNSVQSVPAEISELSETLQTLNLRCAKITQAQSPFTASAHNCIKTDTGQYICIPCKGKFDARFAGHVLNGSHFNLAMRPCSHDVMDNF